MTRIVLWIVCLPAIVSLFAQAEEKKVGLDQSVISEYVNRAMPKLSGCYTAEAKNTKAPLSGRVSMKFVINPDGKVGEASVASTTLKNAKIEGCVTEAIKSIMFPQPEGGGSVEVSYPIEFAPAPKTVEKAAEKPAEHKKKKKGK